MNIKRNEESYQDLFVGVEVQVPLLGGGRRRYVNLDNAASTPPFKTVQRAVDEFLPYYSSVHRGTGFKSQLSTHVYEGARQAVMRFLNASPSEHVCIFGKNTTEAINTLARCFPFDERRKIVLTSGMEHHSNDLPWREVAQTLYVSLNPDGRLNEDEFDTLLEKYADQIALVAITGASNVTGYLNPIHRLAEKAHRAGAQILVDCAQLAPHRKVDMRPLDDPEHLDYISISAHKLYAPFGTGALIGRRDTFDRSDPYMRGGGTIEMVTLDRVVWADPPERDEAGSPNTVGVVALWAAIAQLSEIGMEKVAEHEAGLTRRLLQRLHNNPALHIYGDTDPDRASERLGVVPFGVKGLSHFKVAAILGYEFGIGVRSGCFCAHPYILHLLKLTSEEVDHLHQRMLNRDRTETPGMIRASFGLYNSLEDVEVLIDALAHITHGEYQGIYEQNRASGEFIPQNWTPHYETYYSIPVIVGK